MEASLTPQDCALLAGTTLVALKLVYLDVKREKLKKRELSIKDFKKRNVDIVGKKIIETP